jgi:hypothetical protein
MANEKHTCARWTTNDDGQYVLVGEKLTAVLFSTYPSGQWFFEIDTDIGHFQSNTYHAESTAKRHARRVLNALEGV